MKEFSILAIGGKYFDEKKKGFLNILIFDENSTPVDGNEYKLADEVKDIKFMEDGLSLYMITELKLVLV